MAGWPFRERFYGDGEGARARRDRPLSGWSEHMAPGHCLTCGGCSQPQPTRMAQYATGTPVDLRLCKGFSRGSRVQMDLQQPVISEGKGGADGAACQESASLGSVLCPNTRAGLGATLDNQLSTPQIAVQTPIFRSCGRSLVSHWKISRTPPQIQACTYGPL